MDKLFSSSKKFPLVRFAVVARFHESNRPYGPIFSEGRTSFCKTHNLYGFKMKTSVLPNSICIQHSAHFSEFFLTKHSNKSTLVGIEVQ